MQATFGFSGDKVAQIESAEYAGGTRDQSTHWDKMSKHTSRQIWLPCVKREHGFTCSVHATAFHKFGEHLEIFFSGKGRPGKCNSFWLCHRVTAFLAASSAPELQDRKSSVGRLLKLVQKLSPSQPSSQGLSTATTISLFK